MKDVMIEVPKIEPELTVRESILKIIGNNTLSSFQIAPKLNKRSHSNIRSTMANMVRENYLECLNCPNCDIGKMYRRRK